MNREKASGGPTVEVGSGVEGWRIDCCYDASIPGYWVIDGDGDRVTWFSTYGLAAAYVEGVRLGRARRGEVERGRE